MKSVKDIIHSKTLKKDFRNKYEFQAYGNKLAEELGEPYKRSMYIKLAKTVERALLDRARDYVLGSEKATTKGKLFLWKLAQLRAKPNQDQETISQPLPSVGSTIKG